MKVRSSAWLSVGGLGLVLGGLWLTVRPMPVGEHPARPAVVGPRAPGVLVLDLVDGTSEAERDALGEKLGLTLKWASDASADEALAIAESPDLSLSLAALAGLEIVEAAEPSVTMQMSAMPNDPLYAKQWHLKAMGAPEGWAHTPGGAGVVVAVLDTGVGPVEDLDPSRVLPGKSFVPGVSSSADDQGHGTHVAGTIAQTTNNGLGTAGVAPYAMILPVKVLSASGGGQSEWIAAGIDWAADQGADVINLSLGGSYSKVIHEAVKKARARGVLVVAAAGNSGQYGVSWPGALEEAIGVGAVGPDGQPAPYSSFGPGVDMVAPGGDLRVPDGGVLQNTVDGHGGQLYAAYQGTSMATPHVAGAAAVLRSTGMSPDAVERALLESGGRASWDSHLGYGPLDLGKALSAAVDGAAVWRFGLAVIIGLLIAGMSRTNGAFRLVGALGAGLVAGGPFFVRWLPLGGGPWPELAAAPVLHWPGLLIGPGWVGFPLWLSAIVPCGLAFVFGVNRVGRVVCFAICAGVGSHLVYGALTGALEPWWLPSSLGTLWLATNATLCLLMAMALAGIEQLEEAS